MLLLVGEMTLVFARTGPCELKGDTVDAEAAAWSNCCFRLSINWTVCLAFVCSKEEKSKKREELVSQGEIFFVSRSLTMRK